MKSGVTRIVVTEADTCRKYVVPKLQAAGWEDEPHSIAEQRTFTDGRIIPHGNSAKRRPGKRADYILRYTRDIPVAIVEAKSIYETPGRAMQQSKDYAEILKLKFAYATNGHGILEFDFITGKETEIPTFPTPDELWNRLRSAAKLTLDLLCHLAFNAPLRTRRERADRLKREAKDFFNKFGPEARAVLNDLLDKYTEHGATQFQFPNALKIPPLSNRGSVMEIAGYFGGSDRLRNAVNHSKRCCMPHNIWS